MHCNILRSIKAAFLELEKAMFTGATLVPMFTTITPGCTSWYIDGLIHSVFAGSPTLSRIDDSDTQIQTLYYCITEVYPVLIHWWVVCAILLICWSTTCFITLLSFAQSFYIAQLNPILTHCWGIPYHNTLLRNPQILICCWPIPNPNTLLSFNLTQYIAEHFPISIHTELYSILTHS